MSGVGEVDDLLCYRNHTIVPSVCPLEVATLCHVLLMLPSDASKTFSVPVYLFLAAEEPCKLFYHIVPSQWLNSIFFKYSDLKPALMILSLVNKQSLLTISNLG